MATADSGGRGRSVIRPAVGVEISFRGWSARLEIASGLQGTTKKSLHSEQWAIKEIWRK